MYAAMAVNVLGHGMGLSGDLVLQGAPQLAAKSAGVDVALVLSRGALLSIISVVATIIIYIMMIRSLDKEPVSTTKTKQSIPSSKFHEIL